MSDCLMPVTVQLDGIIDSAKAFHDPKKRWNGAICPWFTQEVALKILEKVNGFAHKDVMLFLENDKIFVEYDSENDSYIEYEGELLDTPFERTILYPIGNCYWMWGLKEGN